MTQIFAKYAILLHLHVKLDNEIIRRAAKFYPKPYLRAEFEKKRLDHDNGCKDFLRSKRKVEQLYACTGLRNLVIHI